MDFSYSSWTRRNSTNWHVTWINHMWRNRNSYFSPSLLEPGDFPEKIIVLLQYFISCVFLNLIQLFSCWMRKLIQGNIFSLKFRIYLKVNVLCYQLFGYSTQYVWKAFSPSRYNNKISLLLQNSTFQNWQIPISVNMISPTNRNRNALIYPSKVQTYCPNFCSVMIIYGIRE